MTDWLGSMNDIVSFVADNKVDFVVGAGGLALASAAGIIPRVGLGRALTLGYRSYFQTTNPLSVRTSEIKHLNDLLLRMERSSYIVVTGERGYGKTCLIDTTLNRQFGVVKISVSCLSYSIVYMMLT